VHRQVLTRTYPFFTNTDPNKPSFQVRKSLHNRILALTKKWKVSTNLVLRCNPQNTNFPQTLQKNGYRIIAAEDVVEEVECDEKMAEPTRRWDCNFGGGVMGVRELTLGCWKHLGHGTSSQRIGFDPGPALLLN
jgi:hypothetical protein